MKPVIVFLLRAFCLAVLVIATLLCWFPAAAVARLDPPAKPAPPEITPSDPEFWREHGQRFLQKFDLTKNRPS